MKHVDLTEPEKETVYSWLRDFNHERNGELMRSLEIEGTEVPLFLSARDETGKVIGGLEGLIIHKWVRIQIMAVEPSQRGQGVGTDLVARAETLALQHGCEHAFVDTMSYQAPGFYEQLGYREVGRVPNWDSHDHDKIYLMKDLDTGKSG